MGRRESGKREGEEEEMRAAGGNKHQGVWSGSLSWEFEVEVCLSFPAASLVTLGAALREYCPLASTPLAYQHVTTKALSSHCQMSPEGRKQKSLPAGTAWSRDEE